jgi:hypothetical protein
MKQLLSLALALLPCLAWAQYPSNGNQKITLGEQTTADGLVYRGLASDTTRKPSVDTMAYILLDTNTNIIWQYKKATNNAWTRVNLRLADTTSFNYVNTYGTQTVNGAKTFTSNIAINTSGQSRTISTFYPSGSDGVNIFIGGGGNNSTTNGGASYLGSYNSAIGVNALFSNTTGYYNSAIGMNALYRNTTGYSNSAIGVNALFSNTTGYSNSAISYDALYSNTTGYRNSAIGMNALYSNTTGYNNAAIGMNALYSNTTGFFNAAISFSALYSNTTGYYNIATGLDALYSNTTGNYNSAIGRSAGYGTGTNANTTGSNNTFIGNEAVGSSATESNVITLGNSSIATIRAQVTTITSLSDIRDKTEVSPLNYGMNFINKLKPVSFVWDMRDGGKIGIPEIGFIAQDLQQAQIDTGINIPNLVSGVDEKLEASYGVLLPIIVKALQEANEKIKSLEQRLLIIENK